MWYNAQRARAGGELLGGVPGPPGRAAAARASPHHAEGRRLDRGARRRQGVQAAQLDEPAVHVREEDGRARRDQPGRGDAPIELHEVLHDYVVELGDDPGLAKDGVEAELQELLAKRVAALRDDLRLVRREYPTDIGPVDLLCRDGDDRAIVVEVKRVGEIAGVEQLLRYQERLDLDPNLAPTRRACSSPTRIKPQAKVFARAAASSASRSTSRSCAPARRSTCGCSEVRAPCDRPPNAPAPRSWPWSAPTPPTACGDSVRRPTCRGGGRRRRPAARPRRRGVDAGDARALALPRARRRPARRGRRRVGSPLRRGGTDRRARGRGGGDAGPLAGRLDRAARLLPRARRRRRGERRAGTGTSVCCTAPRRRAWCRCPIPMPPLRTLPRLGAGAWWPDLATCSTGSSGSCPIRSRRRREPRQGSSRASGGPRSSTSAAAACCAGVPSIATWRAAIAMGPRASRSLNCDGSMPAVTSSHGLRSPAFAASSRPVR